MKTMLQRIIIMIVTIIYAFTAVGCATYREVEDLAIVLGVAIDKEGDRYWLTYEVIEAVPSGEEKQTNTQFFSSEGSTLFEAVRKAITESGKRLFWSHAQVIIVSSKVASEGMLPILDWFVRDSETRPTMWVIISKDCTARDILLVKKQNLITSMHISDIMNRFNPSYLFPKVDLLRLRGDIGSKNITATAPTAALINKGGIKDIQIYGSAVFRKDKMIGWINGNENRNKYIIMGKIKQGLIVLPKAGEKNTNVTLEIFKNKTKNKVIEDKGKISIESNIEMTVAIDEIGGETDYTSKQGVEKLTAYAEENLKMELEALVKKMQKDYDADIFGFGRIIETQKPKLWKQIEKKYESVFRDINYSAKVKINIKGSGRISKPLQKGL